MFGESFDIIMPVFGATDDLPPVRPYSLNVIYQSKVLSHIVSPKPQRTKLARLWGIPAIPYEFGTLGSYRVTVFLRSVV